MVGAGCVSTTACGDQAGSKDDIVVETADRAVRMLDLAVRTAAAVAEEGHFCPTTEGCR